MDFIFTKIIIFYNTIAIFAKHHIKYSLMAKKNNGNPFGDMPMPNEGELKVMFMMALSEMGVTPEEYADYLKQNNDIHSEISRLVPPPGPNILKVPLNKHNGSRKAPKDAHEKTLVIQVKMKDVVKPPMWRQLEIPGEFTFAQLHYAIQAATGLMNCHLWQFQEHAYDSPYSIAIPQREEFGFGVDDCTHDADKTPVMAFLAKKGDKIEYVYDFGDDWIFEVTVKDVVDRRNEVSVCTKWKSDLQPIENFGGVWSYISLRDLLANAENMTKAQRNKAAKTCGFDDYDTMMGYVDENFIDIEFVNETLAEIPDHWKDLDE